MIVKYCFYKKITFSIILISVAFLDLIKKNSKGALFHSFKTQVATLTFVWLQSNYFYNPTLPTLSTSKRIK